MEHSHEEIYKKKHLGLTQIKRTASYEAILLPENPKGRELLDKAPNGAVMLEYALATSTPVYEHLNPAQPYNVLVVKHIHDGKGRAVHAEVIDSFSSREMDTLHPEFATAHTNILTPQKLHQVQNHYIDCRNGKGKAKLREADAADDFAVDYARVVTAYFNASGKDATHGNPLLISKVDGKKLMTLEETALMTMRYMNIAAPDIVMELSPLARQVGKAHGDEAVARWEDTLKQKPKTFF